MSAFKGGEELCDVVPLGADPVDTDRPIRPGDHGRECFVVSFLVDSIDPLVVEPPNARAETLPEHGESSEVDFGVAVGVDVVLLNVEVGLMVEQSVEHVGGVPRRALDGNTVEGGVVVGHERVELDSKVTESGAVGALENLSGVRKRLQLKNKCLTMF